jgi:Protein of unknown function (DUF5131)
MGQPNYVRGFQKSMHEHTVGRRVQWRRPCTIFVNSMSDLFHEAVPDDFVRRVFATMRAADWHSFQVLTKRSQRLSASRTRRAPSSPPHRPGENDIVRPDLVEHLGHAVAAARATDDAAPPEVRMRLEAAAPAFPVTPEVSSGWLPNGRSFVDLLAPLLLVPGNVAGALDAGSTLIGALRSCFSESGGIFSIP